MPGTVVARRGGRIQNMPQSRVPLADVTNVAMASETRRERLGDGIGQVFGGPTPIRTNQPPADQGPSPLAMTVVNRRGGPRRQNTPPSGSFSQRGRGGNSWANGVLPSWYPRTPFADITHVDRAIERRRERLGDVNGQVLGSPAPIRINQQTADQDPSPSGVLLEQGLSLMTPKPNLASKMFKPSKLGKVPTIFDDVANQGGGELEFLTPQGRLLNSMDKVEKVVMDDLARLKRTPAAKKAEREKRVRTLMSMR